MRVLSAVLPLLLVASCIPAPSGSSDDPDAIIQQRDMATPRPLVDVAVATDDEVADAGAEDGGGSDATPMGPSPTPT